MFHVFERSDLLQVHPHILLMEVSEILADQQHQEFLHDRQLVLDKYVSVLQNWFQLLLVGSQVVVSL